MSIQLNLIFFKPMLVLPRSFSALFQYANGLFILPLASAVSQFFMTKVTGGSQPQQQDQSAEQQAAANAMNSGFMKWFFPLFSLYICAQYNAAFAIYWMAANVIQIIQQVAVNYFLDRKEKQAVIETEAVDAE